MMSVDKGVVKAYMQPFGMESIHIFADKITSCLCVSAFIVSVCGVEHVEALMVLCSHDNVFHTRYFSLLRLIFGIIVFFLYGLLDFYLLVSCWHGVQTPMYGHSKTVMRTP